MPPAILRSLLFCSPALSLGLITTLEGCASGYDKVPAGEVQLLGNDTVDTRHKNTAHADKGEVETPKSFEVWLRDILNTWSPSLKRFFFGFFWAFHHSAIAFLYCPEAKVDCLSSSTIPYLHPRPGNCSATGHGPRLDHHVHRVPRHPSWPDAPTNGPRRRAYSTASMRYTPSPLLAYSSRRAVR